MRSAVLLVVAAAALLGAVGCGSEIGDACIVSSDCDPNNARDCDSSSYGGYCTIIGCDYGTCPDESVCVRFFTGSFLNTTCDPATEDVSTDMCNPDELCALDGHCVTKASEVRFCMRKCSSGEDCRDKYECRTVELMKEHGGEPVPPAGSRVDATPQPFCGVAPAQ